MKLQLSPIWLATGALALPAAVLAKDVQLDTVTVSGSPNPHQKALLRDEIIATESVSAREVEKSGATTLTEVLDKRPGISVQTECSICNVRNVVLNNLPGRFTTVMIDGIPIFSSVSSAYGLDSVSLGGVERIDISRGAGTSLVAPEALAGSVNIVTGRPQGNEFQLRQQFGRWGHANTDIFAARVFAGGALTANFNRNVHDSVDNDGNRISEYTGYRRNIGGIGYFLDDAGGFKIKGRLDVVEEKRMGGALGDNYAAVQADGNGNPFDWSRGRHGSPIVNGWVNPAGGPNLIYNDGRAGMSEVIFTDRLQWIQSATRRIGDGQLRIAFGYARHKQDSFYEKLIYKADQDQAYGEVSLQQTLGETLLTAGLNYRYESLRSRGQDAAGTPNDGIDNYTYRTPGVFLQAYRALLDGKLELNGSLRYDDHNVFGGILSPRFNALWNHDHELNSRIAVGRGFRAPTSFFEQDHGILGTQRIIRAFNKAELSDNASYALAYASDRLAWTGTLNWNRIRNMALLDSSQCELGGVVGSCTGAPGETAVTLFTSAHRPVTVAGADFTLTYKLTPQLEGTVAFERFHYRFSEPGTLTFSRPEERAYLRLDYESGPWTLMARGTWTGTQDLARFYDYANNPRYNFDGTRKQDKSPAFWVFDLRGEYRFDKRWAGYLGIDNALDFQQSKKESVLWIDGSGTIDYTHLWGPNRGRFIYAGVKFTL